MTKKWCLRSFWPGASQAGQSQLYYIGAQDLSNNSEFLLFGTSCRGNRESGTCIPGENRFLGQTRSEMEAWGADWRPGIF